MNGLQQQRLLAISKSEREIVAELALNLKFAGLLFCPIANYSDENVFEYRSLLQTNPRPSTKKSVHFTSVLFLFWVTLCGLFVLSIVFGIDREKERLVSVFLFDLLIDCCLVRGFGCKIVWTRLFRFCVEKRKEALLFG